MVCTTIVYVSWSYALQLYIYVCMIFPTHLCRCSSYNVLQFCYLIELLKLGLLHILYILVGTAIVSDKPYNCASNNGATDMGNIISTYDKGYSIHS